MGFLETLKAEFELFHSHIDQYKLHVNSISDLFLLSSSKRLMNDMPPSGFSGRYDVGNSIVLFSLNPGYSSQFNPYEESLQNASWEQYFDARKNLFISFKRVHHPSLYYRAWWIMFKGLLGEKSHSYDTQWDYFNKRLVNLNLIPYHSKGLQLPLRFNEEQTRYLLQNFSSMTDFIMRHDPKCFIFNGNPWFNLLEHSELLRQAEKVVVTQKFNLYFFKLKGIPAVLFDKFFSAPYWGIKNDPHRCRIIPELILKHTGLFFD